MTCDPKDRHVLAGAVVAHADVLVTRNVRDFPPAALAPHGIVLKTPDDYLSGAITDDPAGQVKSALTTMMGDYQRPPKRFGELADRLRQGAPRFAAYLRTLDPLEAKVARLATPARRLPTPHLAELARERTR